MCRVIAVANQKGGCVPVRTTRPTGPRRSPARCFSFSAGSPGMRPSRL